MFVIHNIYQCSQKTQHQWFPEAVRYSIILEALFLFLPVVAGLGGKKDPLGPALAGALVALDAVAEEDGLLVVVAAELEALFAGTVAAEEDVFLGDLLVGAAIEVEALFVGAAATEEDGLLVGAAAEVEALFVGAVAADEDDFLGDLIVSAAAEVEALFVGAVAADEDDFLGDLLVGAATKVEALFVGAEAVLPSSDLFDCIYKTKQ